ncbi:SusC/RagA family TonB-linked outer membrane protein [Pedobacter agri]|uniref:SusC/RagA family TonB-linked outer membrane protein n=1 Tax=Pedobacter agri TaxID=454586 RepID=UPI000E38C16B|nr:SusC/RagA family TonB-linked outer membrane protein [Pedobacter agri]
MKKLLQSLFILMFVAFGAMAQERTVTGTVTSQEDGLPVPGATVRVKEIPNLGAQTGANGKFTLTVPSNGKTIVVTFLGYASREFTIPASNVINAVLASDATSLNEVVVTAGGVAIKRREQGNQSTTVKAEELTQGKAFNVASALTGKVAGLQVNAVSSGVNPNIRLVLRGNRSLLGNNQALVVLDNVIVPSDVLGNLNPEDIENIEVLNGAGAAALYGSDASNGALIITTKKGKRGATSINVSHTTNVEQVSFLPKLQDRFGSGTGNDDIPTYTAFENQQYGPAFDGVVRPIGKPLADGSIQSVPYSYNKDENKDAFWETGYSNQTDFNLSSGDDKGTYYFSGQYFDQKSTVPGDKYNRFSMRINGERNLGNNVTFGFNLSYVQNRYDQGNAIGSVFDNVLQSPGQIPLTRYKDFKNDPFANPNGYYNEYYQNPYFALANSRSATRNDYLTGNAQIKWNPIKDLSLLVRANLSNRAFSNKSTTNKFTYSAYRLASTPNFANIVGGVSDYSGYNVQINPEFQAQYIKQLSKDFSLNVIAGATIRQNTYKRVDVGTQGGLALDDFFNVSNGLQNPSASESNFKARQIGVYGDARLGFRNYLYLHVTGRNDWRSILSPENRSFFYPAADISFIASDAIPFLKNSKVIESLKIRGGVSKVGNVNLGNSTNFGAYALLPTFGQASGYPYAGIPGFTLADRIVSPNIKPEMTLAYEGGIDFVLLKSRISGSFTMYKTNTTDQTVPVSVANSTGFSQFLTNTGEVSNNGIETNLRLVPYRNLDNGLEVSVGANYTYNNNKVVSISNGLPALGLSGTTTLGSWAVEGQPFPVLQGTDYVRDSEGRVIVDRYTGFPNVTNGNKVLGNVEPRHRLGLDAAVSYKGFRLTGLFEYRGGFVMGQNSGSYDFSGAGIRTTYFNRERFVIPNSSYLDPVTNTYVANTNITTRTGGVDFWTNGPTNMGVASNYVYSAAFWKLRELSLSYDLPKSVLGSLKYVKGARISVQGRNLFIWTPKTNIYTDPEYSDAGPDNNGIGIASLGQTPPARFYGATLSLTF